MSHDRAEALADQVTQLRRDNEQLRSDLTACKLERDQARDYVFRHACHCGRQGKNPALHAKWCPYRMACQPTPTTGDNNGG